MIKEIGIIIEQEETGSAKINVVHEGPRNYALCAALARAIAETLQAEFQRDKPGTRIDCRDDVLCPVHRVFHYTA